VNIAELLTRSARSHGEAPAISFSGDTWSYKEMDRRVSGIAGGLLSLGMRRGDRVLLFQRNQPQLLESMFACWRAGLIAVPVNNRLLPAEAAYIAENSGAQALIVSPEFKDVASACAGATPGLLEVSTDDSGPLSLNGLMSGGKECEDAEVDEDDIAWLFYTSGTTGRPKGAMLTHRNLLTMTLNYLAEVAPVRPGDVFLHAAPLTHGSGLYALPAVAMAAKQVIQHTASFDPATFFELIERHSVTQVAFLAPTMIIALLNHPALGQHDLSSLRSMAYGGAPMYVETLKRAVTAFGPTLVQIYGMGEVPMSISVLPRWEHLIDGEPEHERRLSSAGIPRLGMEVAILGSADEKLPSGQIGEIAVRGPVVMKGYWADSAATEESLRGGWLHTGDIGRMDPDGFLYILDRAKDMIISGGANIYPREVEDVLATHPEVLEALVVGVPDPYWGEAVVVLRSGAGATEEEIIAFCRSRLAGHKKPRSIDFADTLPKNAYGKVLKREVRDRYWQGSDRKV
jgi:acyl-CoA synthetase (AMP-forming)/AMP-acid ligase II